MTSQELEALFNEKLLETEHQLHLLSNFYKKKFFKYFVHGFKAANPTLETVEEQSSMDLQVHT
jgi:hypothetical protein